MWRFVTVLTFLTRLYYSGILKCIDSEATNETPFLSSGTLHLQQHHLF
jgi:hypothetical protein